MPPDIRTGNVPPTSVNGMQYTTILIIIQVRPDIFTIIYILKTSYLRSGPCTVKIPRSTMRRESAYPANARSSERTEQASGNGESLAQTDTDGTTGPGNAQNIPERYPGPQGMTGQAACFTTFCRKRQQRRSGTGGGSRKILRTK